MNIIQKITRNIRIEITKLISKIQFHSKPFFLIYDLRGYRFKDTLKILDIIQPGDILLRTYDNYVTSLLIPGTWCHAAIAIDKSTVLHAVGEGVSYEDIIQFARTDKLCILRSNANKEEINNILELAKSQLGKKYDYDFIAYNSSKFYCSELVSFCFKSVINLEPKPTKLLGFIPGPKEIIPDDIFYSKDLNVVYNSLDI